MARVHNSAIFNTSSVAADKRTLLDASPTNTYWFNGDILKHTALGPIKEKQGN